MADLACYYSSTRISFKVYRSGVDRVVVTYGNLVAQKMRYENSHHF